MSEEWKLVPVELTEAMREAYEANSIAPIGPISKYGYRAMLDAAPVADTQEPTAWANDQQLLLCSKSPREVQPNNPMMHDLPRNIAGSALKTDYCNTPLFTRSDAGEIDRLNTVVEQQKNLIASLQEELGYLMATKPTDPEEGDHDGRQLEWERAENKRLKTIADNYSALLIDANAKLAGRDALLIKLSGFARFVIKCVRRNGEYAPLSMQEPHEIEAALSFSAEPANKEGAQ